MNYIFKDMIDKGWLVIYIDDIMIHSSDPYLYEQRTYQVLQWLQENNLYLKLEKCFFNKEEVEFLGLIISYNTIAMDFAKVKGIME